MGNNDSGDCTELLSDSVDGSLHLDFVLFVECRCGLVEYENLRVLNKCSGNSNSLLLSARDLPAGCTHLKVDALRLVVNKLPRVGLLECVDNLIVGNPWASKLDVLFNGSIK